LRTALRTTLFLCTPFLLAYTTFQLFGIRINITSSLPRGLYMVSESHSASLVERGGGDLACAGLSGARLELP
jgi:hypothetical protein